MCDFGVESLRCEDSNLLSETTTQSFHQDRSSGQSASTRASARPGVLVLKGPAWSWSLDKRGALGRLLFPRSRGLPQCLNNVLVVQPEGLVKAVLMTAAGTAEQDNR